LIPELGWIQIPNHPTKGAEMAFDLREALRRMFGGEQKPKSVFHSEQEAYDFLNRVYKETGGVTPELRRAFEFYQHNIKDECREFTGPIEASNQFTQR
jgi:hypothetical protein